MPTTSRLDLRFPVIGAENNPPRFLQELAEDVEDRVLETAIVEFGSGRVWGTAFNPELHRAKVFIDTVVGEPSAGGDITLIANLPSHFAGLGAAVVSFGDITTGREVIPWIYSNDILVARVMNSSGAGITSGGQRLNLVAYGWV